MMSNGAMQQMYPQLFGGAQQQGGGGGLNTTNGGGEDDVSNSGGQQDNSRKFISVTLGSIGRYLLCSGAVERT